MDRLTQQIGRCDRHWGVLGRIAHLLVTMVPAPSAPRQRWPLCNISIIRVATAGRSWIVFGDLPNGWRGSAWGVTVWRRDFILLLVREQGHQRSSGCEHNGCARPACMRSRGHHQQARRARPSKRLGSLVARSMCPNGPIRRRTGSSPYKRPTPTRRLLPPATAGQRDIPSERKYRLPARAGLSFGVREEIKLGVASRSAGERWWGMCPARLLRAGKLMGPRAPARKRPDAATIKRGKPPNRRRLCAKVGRFSLLCQL